MQKFVIEGGARLEGKVRVSGSKNASIPILAATLLADGPCVLHNVPRLRDIETMLKILTVLGVDVRWRDDGALETRVTDQTPITAPYELVSTMRGSVCVLGPLLARRGQAKVSLPGGCVLGVRPIDLHLKGLSALGADIEVRHGYVESEGTRLRGCEVYLGGSFGSTVLGTCNVMMAAAMAEGITVIECAACEPEVEDLGDFLRAMGARIRGAGTPRLFVEGVKRLRGAEHTVIPDRIEAGTFLVGAAITEGDVTVEGVVPHHLAGPIDKLRAIGVEVERGPDRIRARMSGRPRPVDISTLPHPGFPTDLQAQFLALLNLTDGISVVTEKVYPDRFMHVAELNRMGARIRKEGSIAIVQGVPELSGAEVMASDLRASAGLILAGLRANGTTTVNRIYHLDLGYEGIDDKLRALGACVRREEAAPLTTVDARDNSTGFVSEPLSV
jgi:UDP-N-acetylglucosamine 1-carboxyvinyltransferase